MDLGNTSNTRCEKPSHQNHQYETVNEGQWKMNKTKERAAPECGLPIRDMVLGQCSAKTAYQEEPPKALLTESLAPKVPVVLLGVRGDLALQGTT